MDRAIDVLKAGLASERFEIERLRSQYTKLLGEASDVQTSIAVRVRSTDEIEKAISVLEERSVPPLGPLAA